MKSPFAASYETISCNGFHVIPIGPHTKAPSEYRAGKWWPMREWQKYRADPAPAHILRLWSQWDAGNIGVLTGTAAGEGYVLAVVDFDSDDFDILEELQAAIPVSPVQKKGKRGYSAFYRVAAGTVGFRTEIVELLTDTRQTVIPPSVHPDTGRPYVWTGTSTLADVRAEALPLLTEDDLEQFRDTLATLVKKPVPQQRAVVQAADDADASIWRRINTKAYNNLDLWVPELGLPKLQRTATGYKAVAHWRASTTGKLMAQRGQNLSIMAGLGARDFGSGDSYTALNLVAAALSLTDDDAFQWLGTRLGLVEQLPVMAVTGSHDPETGEIMETVQKPIVIPKVDTGDLPDDLTRVPGLLGEVIDWIVASSRRPNRTLAFGAAVTVVGTLMGQAVGGPTMTGTHLFIIGLASSGSGKDGPLKAVSTLLKAANAGDLIGTSSFASMQAVTTFLKRKPLSVCAMDEFGAYIRKINSPKASEHERGISQILRSIWSCNFDAIQTPERASQPSVEIESPALSIFGVSTPKEFFDALDGDAITNGFLNRFLVLPSSKTVDEVDPKLSNRNVPEHLALAMAQLRNRANQITNHEKLKPIGSPREPKFLTWGTGKTVHNEIMAHVKKIRDIDGKEDFYARTVEMALRLATIVVYADNRTAIDATDMEWASRFALWSAGRLETMTASYIAENDTQRLHNRIVRLVMARGGHCSHRELLRALQGSVRSQDLKGVMDNLLASGEFIALKTIPPAGGTPTITYKIDQPKKSGDLNESFEQRRTKAVGY